MSSLLNAVIISGLVYLTAPLLIYAGEISNQSKDQSPIDLARTLPTIKPMLGIYVKGFGKDKNKMHEGLDIKGKMGASIIATAPGIIQEVVGKSGTFRIVIRHNDTLETSYSNLQSIITEKGKKVARGEQIGYAGKSPLYYQVLVEGVPVDPLQYILEH